MTREDMWKEFKNQLIREIRTPITMSYDSSIKMSTSAIKETVAKWKKRLEQQSSEDCISRQAMLDAITEIDGNINMDIYTNEVREIVKELPTVTLTHCIAEVRFSKEDLREICNERIEIECTHGTCKDCKHNYKTSGNTFECSNGHRFALREPSTFYCADFEKRGNKND